MSDSHQSVTDSTTRILRSKGQKKEKRKVFTPKKTKDQDSVDEEDDNDGDNDYIIDDVNDEDWVEENEDLDYLNCKIKRDTFGRFVVKNRQGVKKKKSVPILQVKITNKKHTGTGLPAGGSKQVADAQIENSKAFREEYQNGGNTNEEIHVGISKETDEDFKETETSETNELLQVADDIETNDNLVDIIETNEDMHIGVSKDTVEELQTGSSEETQFLTEDSKETVEEFQTGVSQDTNKDIRIGDLSDVPEECLSDGNIDTNE